MPHQPNLRLLLTSALLVAVLPAGTACGGGSPSQPETPDGTGNIVILDAQGLLSAHHATIRQLIEQAVARARTELDVDQVTITVSPDASRSIPGYGIGGYAPNGFAVEIAIDPSFPALAEILPERLPPTIAHELHHNARWRGPGYGATLLESMISEGLADHFAIELLGTPVQPWSKAFSRNLTDHYLDLARPEFDSTNFDFGGWFFGTGSELPRWTGYTLGFRLVEDYQGRHPGQSAAALVDTPAEVFRPDSGS